METKSPNLSAPADNMVITTRIFSHSRQLVFEAWTNPERLKNWWGPNGFTNTFYEFDLRPGGMWRFTMHGPDGTNYPNESIFVQIDVPELIIFDHLSQPQFQIVATFEELQETKTRLTFRMIFKSADQYNALRSFVQEKNEENFDRLEIELQRDDFFYT
ncbi:MAG: SRPBCC family protein [Prolixibacteraceae bacterium]|nr:SRPBCC family protein [Prolixibacteraceae bacterium]